MDQNNRKKIIQAINLVEELSWLFDSKKNVDLKEIPILLRGLIDNNSNGRNQKYESPNPNKNYLIGILPNLFTDEELFNTTNDLIIFAQEVLKIPVSKAAKRSRFEYIGLIICEIVNLNEADLTNLVDALSLLTDSKENLKKFKEAKKKANFSWNDAIQQLTSL